MNKKIQLISLFSILLLVFLFLPFFPIYSTNAATISLNTFNSYTDVLTDLESDPDFSIEDYPVNNTDKSIQVIQIAESSANELFIYTYQPSGTTFNIIASSINISTGINDNVKYENYRLSLLSNSSVFYKYRVENFSMLSDIVRYYEISSILRPFDEEIDIQPDNNNTISEIGLAVGKLFTACTYNDSVSYSCIEREIVTITSKYVGVIRYLDSFSITGTDHTDSHFVAFSCDWSMDKLYEADVQYLAREYKDTSLNLLPGDLLKFELNKEYDKELSEITPTFVTLDHTQQATNIIDGVLDRHYTWNRIQTANDFIATEDLSDTSKQNIQGLQYVLRFAETPFGDDQYGVFEYVYGTEVSEVMILRLKFEKNGIIYNLGVVDTKQTGSGFPDNFDTQQQAWKILIALVLLVLVVVICSPLLPLLLNLIAWIFKSIWNAIKWVISLPFKIFKKRE